MHSVLRTSILTVLIAVSLTAFIGMNPPAIDAGSTGHAAIETQHQCGSTCTHTIAAQCQTEPSAEISPANEAHLAMIDPVIAALPRDAEHCFCFAPDTDSDLVRAFCDTYPELCGLQSGPRHQLATRWSGGSLGDPTVVTWSLVPDSTPGASSYLFSGMDAKFGGNRALWISLIEDCFERWGELTGVSYIRVTDGVNDWDDGASWGTSGNDTTRGDVRIRMIDIDGPSNILAFNSYPDNGDMSLDGAESWGSSSGNYIFLRNVVMHEHGHGLGMAHVCPLLGGTSGRLLEPFYSSLFDGPRHDDVRAIHRGYGDAYEPDDNSGDATDIGTISFGSPVTLGQVPTPSIPFGSLLSIDNNGDQDWFRFTVTTPAEVTVTVTPLGFVYDSSTQSCPGATADCCSGNIIDSEAIANLNVQVYRADTLALLATGDASPTGSAETLANVPLVGSPGDFFIRVYEGDSPIDCQLYRLDVSVFDTTADISPPTPNPAEWSSEPTPASTTSITMTAEPASDPSGVQYLFASGGGSPLSTWQASNVFTKSGLQTNFPYSFKVKARDLSPQQNETAYSTPDFFSATAIQTPTGLSFANVTDTSMDVTATGTFSNLAFGDSGLYFEMTPAAGTGANTWTSGTSDTTVSVTGLTPGTNYTFRVKARNYYGSRGGAYETPFTSPADQATTGGVSCATFGDVNEDSLIDGRDIAGFTRAKLGQPAEPGENQACADNGGTTEEDISDFIDELLN
jgi:hypothetical protein